MPVLAEFFADSYGDTVDLGSVSRTQDTASERGDPGVCSSDESWSKMAILLLSFRAISLLSLLCTIEFLVLVWPAFAVIPLSPDAKLYEFQNKKWGAGAYVQ